MHSHPVLLYHGVPFRSFFSSSVRFFRLIRKYLCNSSLEIVLLFQVIQSGLNLPPYLRRRSSGSCSSLTRRGFVRFREMTGRILPGNPLPDNSPTPGFFPVVNPYVFTAFAVLCTEYRKHVLTATHRATDLRRHPFSRSVPARAEWRWPTVLKYHTIAGSRESCRIRYWQHAFSRRFLTAFPDSSGIRVRM